MSKTQLKIDIYNHIFPAKYVESLSKMGLMQAPGSNGGGPLSTLYDLDLRFRVMDRYEGLMHVLTMCTLFWERIVLGWKIGRGFTNCQ